VGIDSKSGNWNAPCRGDGRFCYAPIPDGNLSDRSQAFDHYFSEIEPFVKQLGAEWPSHLLGTCHLDPDFGHLTYGDNNGGRGQRIRKFLSAGDFIVFWAGLRCIENNEIVCSIIGFYTIAYIINVSEVGPLDAHRNAHTRYAKSVEWDDVLVFGKPDCSGRLWKHIPIGGFRDGAQRVERELLKVWGGLQKADGSDWSDGYITLSGQPPIFRHPDRFLEWFWAKKPKLAHANNV
jgi:hypothetical protein